MFHPLLLALIVPAPSVNLEYLHDCAAERHEQKRLYDGHHDLLRFFIAYCVIRCFHPTN